MVEKQFPQFHRQDPFFSDSARADLNAAGIRVRTAAEFEREERALFESAIGGATILATLSYPEFDGRSERNLPSLFLETVETERTEARTVRPKPRSLPPPSRPAQIRGAASLAYLRQKTARLSPSGLETYLQCAFQYFSMRMLRLKSAPPRPEERLDFMKQGSIVHEVLASWWTNRSNVETLFEAAFARECMENTIPVAYHTERWRSPPMPKRGPPSPARAWKRSLSSRSMDRSTFPER
jgi:ATP-dependent helicase/DNAse subunit B